MRYRLPSLNAIRALEAAGRRRSLSAAASELNVTVGAISRHVALLEGHFGRTLLRRHPWGVEPTPDCAAYIASLGRAFDEIDAASHRLTTDRQRGNTLKLRFYSTFTTEWLSARLGEFKALYPDIRLDLSLSMKDVDWRDDDYDLALTGNPPAQDEFRCERLFETYLSPVCAPRFIGEGVVRETTVLAQKTLLMAPREADLWAGMLAALKMPDPREADRIYFDSLSMTYQAARHGAGIALGNLFIISDDLLEGRLVLPFQQIFLTRLPHYVVARHARAGNAAVKAFRSWLLDAASRTQDALEPILQSRIICNLP